MGEWVLRRFGLSTDLRTNRWEITPGCGHKRFNPPTTMYATQFVQCDTCGAEAIANYNDMRVAPLSDAP